MGKKYVVIIMHELHDVNDMLNPHDIEMIEKDYVERATDDTSEYEVSDVRVYVKPLDF